MKKMIVALLLAAFCAAAGLAQAKPRLGVLPFTGAGADGETIARLFSFDRTILDAFTVIPRTGQVDALFAEQRFQGSGYTDSDSVARLGKMLNADYVISGHIRSLGTSKLVIATIINVQTFEQLAGDYKEYKAIDEVSQLIPAMSAFLAGTLKKDTSKLPRLAIAPFEFLDKQVNTLEAETLAQILSIEIGRTGKYAVLSRTLAIQDALKELNIQASDITSAEGRAAIGKAANAQYVLNGYVSSLGDLNMFEASILDMEQGSVLTGDYENYKNLADGTTLMVELAKVLAGQKSARELQAREENKQRTAKVIMAGAAAKVEAERKEAERWQKERERRQKEQYREERLAKTGAWWGNNHSSIMPWSTNAGYIYQPDCPGGFLLGIAGAYATLSFSEATHKETSTSTDKDTGKNKEETRTYNDYIVMTFGYTFNIIDKWLAIPIGAGFRSASTKPASNMVGYGGTSNTSANKAVPIFEIGAEFCRLGIFDSELALSLPIRATCRWIGGELSFSFGVGLAFSMLGAAGVGRR